MGKTARWFRALIGVKPSHPNPNTNTNTTSKDKRRWSFVKSYKHKEKPSSRSDSNAANNHAIALAAATAVVAEAAIAAAQAADAVVRLTSGTPTPAPVTSAGGRRQLVRAVVVIQSYFRGYLARRALRALKGLVKLQAHVRGHIMRRKTAETMRCMQSMLRAQARARSVRAYIPESPHSSCKSSQMNHPGPPTPEKFEQIVRVQSSKHDQSPNVRRNMSRPSSRGMLCSSSLSDPQTDEPTWDLHGATSSRTHITDEDRADKILEVDTVEKPHFTNRRRKHPFDQTFYSGLLTQQTDDDNELLYCTAENSPQCYSATLTPTRSDGSRSFVSGISDCPSYMSYTESSKAKIRSMSAPKQRPRPRFEKGSSGKRFSVHGLGENNQRLNSFNSNGYPGSGRLDRLGMPVKDNTVVYYSGYLN